jgi:hypothetical protein
MLLANMAKDESLKRILTLERAVPKDLSSSKNAMDQLMDCFVKGAEGKYNKNATYDYLSYFFADIAKVWTTLHGGNTIELTEFSTQRVDSILQHHKSMTTISFH